MAGKPLDSFVADLRAMLDNAALSKFGPMEEWSLRTSMTICGMTGYPAVTGDPDGARTSGEMRCEACGNEYFKHPLDWRVIGYGSVPFLNVLCDGRRVKL